MPDWLKLTLALLVLVLLVAGSIAANVAVRRYNRRKYAEQHPEKRPYGWSLALRASPFIALSVACAIWGASTERWTITILGAIAVVGFLLEIARRWNRPTAA